MMKTRKAMQRDHDLLVQQYNEAIAKVVDAFTSKKSEAKEEFCSGLTLAQYTALRNLNVIRIDTTEAKDRLDGSSRLY